MKRLSRQAALLTAFILLLSCAAVPALAAVDVPYDSYTYSFREYTEFTPAPYVPAGAISGQTLGVGSFRNPQGICAAPDGRLYIADTDNDRIVVVSADMTAAEIIDSFDNGGERDTFNKPYGVTMPDSGLLYIADTNNRRVVVLDGDTAVQIISNPTSEMLSADYVFTPLKLGVDYAGRVYVIARNVPQGIMVFSPEGDFQGYFGTINVTVSLWQRIWRRFSTQAQLDKMALFIPTEFTGVSVDSAGFIYASCIAPQGGQAAFRLNPKGQDVIKKGENDDVGGDIPNAVRHPDAGPYDGPSQIVDIVIRDKGIYSMLDRRRGRVFTYDYEGNLLYVFGGLGSQTGTFKQPCAIEDAGDKLLVLDSDRQEVMIFAETEYGRLINEAVGLRNDGDEALAVDLWRQVLSLNENLELANVGIGKAYLTEGNNKEAMKYLKLGMSRTYYSLAFKRYRNNILKENLGTILTVVLAAALGLYIWNVFRHKGAKKGDLLSDE